MAKVVITIEDSGDTITLDAEFEQPGKTYAEMTENPTKAVYAGLAVVRVLVGSAESYKGPLTDDDGTVSNLTPQNPL